MRRSGREEDIRGSRGTDDCRRIGFGAEASLLMRGKEGTVLGTGVICAGLFRVLGDSRPGDTPLRRGAPDGRGGSPGRSYGISLARYLCAERGGAVEADIGASTGADGICTIKGFVAREGSGPGRVFENPISLASCLAFADGAGDRSSNERRVGGSVVGRAGGGLTFVFPTERG
jgi:hypothetical protein